MSHFVCEQCGLLLIDTDRGYINGCEHYPADIPHSKLTRRERCLVNSNQANWEREQMEALIPETD